VNANPGSPDLRRTASGPRDGPRALLIQSGSPLVVARALPALRARLPDLHFSMLVRRDAVGRVPAGDGVDVLVVDGPKTKLVRDLRARRFSRAFVLFANDRGYWKLKLLPFLLGVPSVEAINENLGCFPLGWRHLGALARHLRWRMESSVTFAGEAQPWAVTMVAKLALYPLTLAYLLVHERVRHLAMRLRGGRNWKREGGPPERRG